MGNYICCCCGSANLDNNSLRESDFIVQNNNSEDSLSNAFVDNDVNPEQSNEQIVKNVEHLQIQSSTANSLQNSERIAGTEKLENSATCEASGETRKGNEYSEPETVERKEIASPLQFDGNKRRKLMRGIKPNEKYAPVKINEKIVKSILMHTHLSNNWKSMDFKRDTCSFVIVSKKSQEYRYIARKFRETNKPFFKIREIVRVQNPYLLAAFLLKLKQLKQRHGSVKKNLMFHGSTEENIGNICRTNFNWRLCGANMKPKFGKGVYFSPISHYATHYCDEYVDCKMMLAVWVLISRACIGNNNVNVPPKNCDSTRNKYDDVFVKYEDNEFYPAYKITYYED